MLVNLPIYSFCNVVFKEIVSERMAEIKLSGHLWNMKGFMRGWKSRE